MSPSLTFLNFVENNMVAIPKKTGTVSEIDKKEYGGKPRPYLGMSGIGEPCWRKLWYGFHWVNPAKYSARTERIFSIGHLFEAIAVENLKKAGCKVFKKDKSGKVQDLTGEIGEEQEEMIGFAGHAKGHNDGRIIGLQEAPQLECVLELKTMADKYFKTLAKEGVEKSQPVYFSQMQKYMGKMNLRVAFFLAINKNTCEYYSEFVEFDHEVFKELERKERIIITSDEPPERAYASNFYKCNWCDHYSHCHIKRKEVAENCRTCDYCDLEDGGIWSCTNKIDEKELSVDEQRAGCSHWELGWGL